MTMRRHGFLLLAIWAMLATCGAALAQEEETAAQRDARMKWWREARFGMFIHWGVYSVPAGTYNGKQIPGIGEWIMNRGKIPVAEYKKFAAQFNPVKFDADQWVRLAKSAGMKYLVITSKHHDGFGMFDSKVTDWCITRATPFKRDPIKELSEACKKHGIKFGLYYSQAQDWCHPGGAASGGHWDKAQEGDMDAYIQNIAVPQVREILTNYAPLAVLWWDTPTNMTKERAEMILPLLKLQPGIIYNNRLGGGYHGDTETPEQHIPATGYPGRDWETCMTMNDTWGFKSYDDKWKSTETLVRNLIDIASKGGNYLLNIGPTAEGLIPEPSVERLKEVGKWMDQFGESIYATTAGPFKRLPSTMRCTRKSDANGTTLYLHLFQWPEDGTFAIPGLKNEIESAVLVGDAKRGKLRTERSGANWLIHLVGAPTNPIASVVAVRIKGEPDVETPLQTQDEHGNLTLAADDAVCHGAIKVESTPSNIGFWMNPADWVEWSFVVNKPGRFSVTADIAAVGPGSKLTVAVGLKSLEAEVPKTGDYKKYKKIELGTLEITSTGKAALVVKPVEKGWRPINLRSVTLKLQP